MIRAVLLAAIAVGCGSHDKPTGTAAGSSQPVSAARASDAASTVDAVMAGTAIDDAMVAGSPPTTDAGEPPSDAGVGRIDAGIGASAARPYSSDPKMALIEAFDRGDYKAARKKANAILAKDKKAPGALRVLASIACAEGKKAEAKSWFKKLGPQDQPQIRTRCARVGVTL
jgi:hypothetical protein